MQGYRTLRIRQPVLVMQEVCAKGCKKQDILGNVCFLEWGHPAANNCCTLYSQSQQLLSVFSLQQDAEHAAIHDQGDLLGMRQQFGPQRPSLCLCQL